ncbi:ABC-2 type transport system permease protein [Gracilibacillus halotolerans]|uniref:ABC-2 type transport system permease protein n=1 Tax=Gracilibacillus halotolerans TaxID=74386 RepID=A0A841RMI9_9BACI|nr:ABC transporter permease [Gracilibacillus halotolerans]MBB6512666.1 ABC-2 type transport system permease protein [Gracilibacillus halotolerans]
MNKFGTVFGHTFKTKIMSKSFIWTTIIFVAFIILFGNIQSIISLFDSEETRTIAVVTEDTEVFEQLEASISEKNDDLEVVLYQGSVTDAQNEVKEDKYNGVLEVTMNEQEQKAVFYTTLNANQTLGLQLRGELEQIKTEIATVQAGIESHVIDSIFAPLDFQNEYIQSSDQSASSVKTESELNSARGLVYIILFLLYFAVITYGNMIAMDIANEKTSRVMEILISSSSPVSQMFAKILSIGLVGLVQISIFLMTAFIIFTQKKDEMIGSIMEEFGFTNFDFNVVIYAIIFFLLGYFLYATLSAMLGSLVSRTEDVQQLMMPVTLLIIVAFFIAMYGLGMPNSKLVVIASYIPFFSPLAMFLRAGLLSIPMWEIALSIGILVASIAILAWIGARVYRGGVLMYGPSSSLKDFKRAIQLSKKE